MEFIKILNYYLKKFYQTDEAKSYSKIYLEKQKKDYNKRIKNIYLPKANFLIENLKKEKKINYIKNKYQFIDIGCGSGYFLSSLKNLKSKILKDMILQKIWLIMGIM